MQLEPPWDVGQILGHLPAFLPALPVWDTCVIWQVTGMLVAWQVALPAGQLQEEHSHNQPRTRISFQRAAYRVLFNTVFICIMKQITQLKGLQFRWQNPLGLFLKDNLLATGCFQKLVPQFDLFYSSKSRTKFNEEMGEMTDPARYDNEERYELSLSVIALVKTELWLSYQSPSRDKIFQTFPNNVRVLGLYLHWWCLLEMILGFALMLELHGSLACFIV